MVEKRQNLTDGIQAEVLKRSRRRCCVCYGLNRDTEIKKGQIAHLDQNRNNNNLDNLVFLCLDHHDEYDSKTSQSKGLRQKEIEGYRVELDEYLQPITEGSIVVTDHDLLQRVLLEISLIPHRWKNHYMGLYPGHFREGTFTRAREYEDAWEMMIDVSSQVYSSEAWQHYRDLFTDEIKQVVEELEKTIMMFGEDLPASIKLAILQANSQLRTEAHVYNMLPHILTLTGDEKPEAMFLERFRSTLRVLANVSRLADDLRSKE